MFRLHLLPVRLVALTLILSCTAASRAQETTEESTDQGLQLLDQATELKLNAESLDDLGRVIELCKEAKEAGLDDDSRQFADQLSYSCYYERGVRISDQIIAAAQQGQISQREFARYHTQAMADMEQALAINDEDPELHFALGRLLAMPGGDRTKALKSLETAAEKFEQPPRKSEALTLAASLQENPEESIKLLDRAVELMPDNADARQGRGLVLMKLGRESDALADFEKALELRPDNPGLLNAKAGLLLMQDRAEEALTSYDELIDLMPDNTLLRVQRARAYAALKRWDEALVDIDAALQDQPDNPELLIQRVELLLNKPDLDLAAATLKKVRDLVPDNPTIRLELARLFIATKRPRRALKLLDDLVKLQEGLKDVWRVYRLRADAYLNIPDHEKAVVDYEKVLAEQPDDDESLNNLAWLLATSPNEEVRNAERAIELGLKASELTEYKAPHILSTLAAGYAEAGDFEKAREWSQKAVELEEQDEESTVIDQLRQELESYRQEKPWREELSTPDEPPLPGETAETHQPGLNEI